MAALPARRASPPSCLPRRLQLVLLVLLLFSALTLVVVQRLPARADGAGGAGADLLAWVTRRRAPDTAHAPAAGNAGAGVDADADAIADANANAAVTAVAAAVAASAPAAGAEDAAAAAEASDVAAGAAAPPAARKAPIRPPPLRAAAPKPEFGPAPPPVPAPPPPPSSVLGGVGSFVASRYRDLFGGGARTAKDGGIAPAAAPRRAAGPPLRQQHQQPPPPPPFSASAAGGASISLRSARTARLVAEEEKESPARAASAGSGAGAGADAPAMSLRSWPLLEHLSSLLTVGALDVGRLQPPSAGATPAKAETGDAADDADDAASDTDGSEDASAAADDADDANGSSGGSSGSSSSDSFGARSAARQRARRDLIDDIFGDSASTPSVPASGGGRAGAAARGGRATHASLTARDNRPAGLERGVRGPVLRSSLRAAFDGDATSRALWEALRAEVLPAALAEQRGPCYRAPTPAPRPAGTSDEPPAPPPMSGAPIYGSGAGSGGSGAGSFSSSSGGSAGSGGGTLAARGGASGAAAPAGGAASGGRPGGAGAASGAAPSPSAALSAAAVLSAAVEAAAAGQLKAGYGDALRIAVARLAEVDFRETVAALLRQLAADGAPRPLPSPSPSAAAAAPPAGASRPVGMSAGSARAAAEILRGPPPPPPPLLGGGGLAALPSASPSAPPPPREVALHAHELPPRPFLAHDGRLDISRGRPVLVVGAGAGLFSLRAARDLPNTTLLSLSWATPPPPGAGDDDSAASFPPPAVHALLKAELGPAAAGSSWVADAARPPSADALRGLAAYLRPRLFADPLRGGLLPPAARAAEARLSRARARDENSGQGEGEDGDLEEAGEGEGAASDSEGGVRGAEERFDYSRDVTAPALARLRRALLADSGALAEESADGEQHDEEDAPLALDLLVLSDLAALAGVGEFAATGGAADGDGAAAPPPSRAMLPFEFERALAALLTLSRHTLVAPAAGGSGGGGVSETGLPSSRFFAYWPSLEELVRAAVRSAGMVPTLRRVGSGAVLVAVQTHAEAAYEAELYAQASASASAATAAAALFAPKRGSFAQPGGAGAGGGGGGGSAGGGGAGPGGHAFVPPAPGRALGRRAAPGFVLHFCPDSRPRARSGALHPSLASGDFGRGLPLRTALALGLVPSDAAGLSAQAAAADLPTGLVAAVTPPPRGAATRAWTLVGPRLLLATGAVPSAALAPVSSSAAASAAALLPVAAEPPPAVRARSVAAGKRSEPDAPAAADARKQPAERGGGVRRPPKAVAVADANADADANGEAEADNALLRPLRAAAPLRGEEKEETEEAFRVSEKGKRAAGAPVAVARKRGTTSKSSSSASRALEPIVEPDVADEEKSAAEDPDAASVQAASAASDEEKSAAKQAAAAPASGASAASVAAARAAKAAALAESEADAAVAKARLLARAASAARAAIVLDAIEEEEEKEEEEEATASKSKAAKLPKLAAASLREAAATEDEEGAEPAADAEEAGADPYEALLAGAAAGAEEDEDEALLLPQRRSSASKAAAPAAAGRKAPPAASRVRGRVLMAAGDDEGGDGAVAAAKAASSLFGRTAAVARSGGAGAAGRGRVRGAAPPASDAGAKAAAARPVAPKAAAAAPGDPPVAEGEEERGPLVPLLTDTRWANIRPLRAPTVASAAPPPAVGGWQTPDAEAAEQALLVAREAAPFRAWWRLLRSELAAGLGAAGAAGGGLDSATFSLLLQGRDTALLSAKLARACPLATLLVVKTEGALPAASGSAAAAGGSVAGAGGSADAHGDLLRLLGARNVMMLSPFALSRAHAAAAAPGAGGGVSAASARLLAAARDPLRLAAFVGTEAGGVWPLLAAAAPPLLAASPLFAAGEAAPDAGEEEAEAQRLATAIAFEWEGALGAVLRLAWTSLVELAPFERLLAPLLVLSGVARCGPAGAPCALDSIESSDQGGAARDAPFAGVFEGDEEDGAPAAAPALSSADEGRWRRAFAAALDADESEGGGPTPEAPGSTRGGSVEDSGDADEEAPKRAASSLFSRTRPRGLGRSLMETEGTPPRHSAASAALRTLESLWPAATDATASGGSAVGLGRRLALRVAQLLRARYGGGAAAEAPAGEEGPNSAAFARHFEPLRRLALAAAQRAGLADARARFVFDTSFSPGGLVPTAVPLVVLRIDAWPWAASASGAASDAAAADANVARPGVSLHTLLVLGAPPALRARLMRLHLSLPLNAIVRAAAELGLAIAPGSPGGSEALAVAPTDLRLVRSQVLAAAEDDTLPRECAFHLVFSLAAAPAGATGPSTRFRSALCLTEPLASITADGGPSPLDARVKAGGVAPGGGSLSGGSNKSGGFGGGDRGDDEAVREAWAALASQLTPLDTATGNALAGRFSFVEYGSGLGELSLAVARAFPEATVLSVDGDGDEADVTAHLAASLRGGIFNNIIAKGVVGAELFTRLHDSPEFFRYQANSADLVSVLARGGAAGAPAALQAEFGTLLALAATTFLRLPSDAHLSLALTTFADSYADGAWLARNDEPGGSSADAAAGCVSLGLAAAMGRGAQSAAAAAAPAVAVPAACALAAAEAGGAAADAALTAFVARFALPAHPRAAFRASEMRLLAALVRAPPGSDAIRVVAAPVPAPLRLPRSMDDISPAQAPAQPLGLAAAIAASAASASATAAAPPAPPAGSQAMLPRGLSSGLVRVDLASLTRHVNHHFQSGLDGHSRKYTLRVQANYSASAALVRALDAADGEAEPSVAAVYAALPHGHHPNHGHSVHVPPLPPAPAAMSAPGAGALPAAAAKAAARAAAAAAEAYAAELAEACDAAGLHAGACAGAASAGLLGGAVLPGVTSIILTRDTDGALIPYDSVHGITLITGLRLGLLAPLRARAYHQFVALPLYQDMAPWNIVFLGARLDYIDYDTRDRSYDAFVPHAYEVMEVLFNYKRTVEDFRRCGSKAGNPYNFPFVSDCVGGGGFSGPCKDSRAPVPCGDGSCRSDYVSCLRALSAGERAAGLKGDLLWAFKAYEAAKGGAGAGTLGAGGSGSSGGAGADGAGSRASGGGGGGGAGAADNVDAAPAGAFASTLYGKSDRTAGAERSKQQRGAGDAADEAAAAAAEAAEEAKARDEAAAQRRRRARRSAKLLPAGAGDEGGFLGGALEYTTGGWVRPS